MKKISQGLEFINSKIADDPISNKEKYNDMYIAIKKANLNLNVERVSELEYNSKVTFLEQAYNCVKCKNADICPQNAKFNQPIIVFEDNTYYLAYQKCNKRRGKIHSYIDITKYDDYYKNEDRDKILTQLLKGEGGYIFGLGGRGKTYTMSYVANHFNKQGKNIYFDLANSIQKNVMNFDTRNKTLDDLIEADYLFIDDIGGDKFTENNVYSCWTMIIKMRIDKKKPIYFSSNFSLDTILKKIENVTDKTTSQILLDRLSLQGVWEFKDINYRRN